MIYELLISEVDKKSLLPVTFYHHIQAGSEREAETMMAETLSDNQRILRTIPTDALGR